MFIPQKCHVGIYNPRFSAELRKVAALQEPLRKGVLIGAQFPETLTDSKGTITKPTNW